MKKKKTKSATKSLHLSTKTLWDFIFVMGSKWPLAESLITWL